MTPAEAGPADQEAALRNIRERAARGEFRVTQHAHREMAEESILLDEVLAAIDAGDVLENYPNHRRGPCCLLHGRTGPGRDLHIVCTTVQPMLVIITVYEPRPPKWPTPTRRSART